MWFEYGYILSPAPEWKAALRRVNIIMEIPLVVSALGNQVPFLCFYSQWKNKIHIECRVTLVKNSLLHNKGKSPRILAAGPACGGWEADCISQWMGIYCMCIMHCLRAFTLRSSGSSDVKCCLLWAAEKHIRLMKGRGVLWFCIKCNPCCSSDSTRETSGRFQIPLGFPTSKRVIKNNKYMYWHWGEKNGTAGVTGKNCPYLTASDKRRGLRGEKSREVERDESLSIGAPGVTARTVTLGIRELL